MFHGSLGCVLMCFPLASGPSSLAYSFIQPLAHCVELFAELGQFFLAQCFGGGVAKQRKIGASNVMGSGSGCSEQFAGDQEICQ